MPDESAYAHLGNALQLLYNVKLDLPENTVALTVATVEVDAIIRRVEAARAALIRFQRQAVGNPLP